MNVGFDTLTGAAIGHVVSQHVAQDDQPARWPRGGLLLLAMAVLGIASHGVLDGLKHSYPASSRVDIGLSVLVAAAWEVLVKPRYGIVFVVAFCSAWLPDVIDLGPSLVRRLLGSHDTIDPSAHPIPLA